MSLQEERAVYYFFLKKHNFIIDSLEISHHIHQSHPFPSPSILALYPCIIALPGENLKKIIKRSILLLHLSHLSINSSFVLMALGPAVCHSAYTFGQAANVHCVVCCQSGSRPLVSHQYKAFTENSSRISCCCPESLRRNSGPMPLCTSAGPDEVDVGAGQVKALDLGQGGS